MSQITVAVSISMNGAETLNLTASSSSSSYSKLSSFPVCKTAPSPSVLLVSPLEEKRSQVPQVIESTRTAKIDEVMQISPTLHLDSASSQSSSIGSFAPEGPQEKTCQSCLDCRRTKTVAQLLNGTLHSAFRASHHTCNPSLFFRI